jgi:macrolide transport system ATP-binding/permease protein
MPKVRAWLSRLIGLFRKNRRDAEMTEEMQAHLDLLTERKIAAGISPNEAKNAARREFGGLEQIKEVAREERLWISADEFLQDLRFGFRMLFRNPGFSALAILCLTLGIGTNAAVFSWIEGMLFRPYPAVAHQERMVALSGTLPGTTGFNALSYPDLLDFERNCTLFESFIVDRIMGTTLSVGDRAEWAAGGIVSANYFDALGVRPVLGRGFRPEEATGRNAHPVTVISYQTWQDRYQGDPAIIGRTQYLGGVQHTIIGVAPENFYGTFVGYAFQFWVPTSMQEIFDPPGYKLDNRGAHWIEGYAFLKPGVTRAQAQAQISAVAKELEKTYPETNRGRGVELLPLSRTPFNAVGNLAPILKVALAVVLFVLLIVCANVSNLLLVRSLLRRHEITMRLALGARRSRLIKQLFTEGLILSVIAGAGGILMAYWCRDALVLAFPAGVPGIVVNFPGRIDGRVLAFSVAVCILATLLSGIIPALQASDVDLTSALKTDGGGVVGGHGRTRLRSALVVLQICLSFILIAGGGLLLQSLRRIEQASPGFDTTGVITSGIDLVSAGYHAERARIFQDQLLDRLHAVPGVESAARARVRPFSFRDYSSAPLAIDGYEPAPNEQLSGKYNEVSEDYFKTLGIPLVAGRGFTRTDDENAPLVAIVDQTMAAKYWPGKSAIGQRLQVNGRWMQVIGIAQNCNYRTKLETKAPFFYVPIRQNFSIQGAWLIRTRQSPGVMMSILADEIHALDPNLGPLDTISMEEEVDRMSYNQRLSVSLLAIFGAMALLLASVGLYAVMSYAVSQSTREFGLRMALGARAIDLLPLVMSRGLVLTAAGMVIGAIAALALTRLMINLLFQVSPRDPLAFGAAFMIMTIVALVACFLPAWRAMRIDPVRALRS